MKDQTTRIHYLKPEVMSNTLAGHRLLPNTQAIVALVALLYIPEKDTTIVKFE
jgi:hypothetical protein